MKVIVQRLHYLIVIYTIVICYFTYEEQLEQVASLKSQIPALQQQIKRKKSRVTELKKYFKDIEEAKRKIQVVGKEFEKLQEKLPNSAEISQTLDEIKSNGEKLNILDLSLIPNPETNKGFYYNRVIDIQMKATYLQFLIFLEKIGDMERLINIDSLNLTKSKSKQKGRYQLVDAKIRLETFRQNTNYSTDSEIKSIEGNHKI